MFTEKKNHHPIKIDLENLIKKNNFEIEYLSTYLSSSTDSLKERERELQEKVNSDAEKNPNDEQFLQDLYENEIYKVSSYFYNSSIVLIYTFLENALYNICSDIQSKIGSQFSYKDLSGNNLIKKSKYYLELTTSISFKNENHKWDRITQFQKLRNYIIHQNSTVTDQKSIEIFKNMFPDIEMYNGSFFIRDHSLALEFLSTIKEFLSFIYQCVRSTSFLGKETTKQKTDDQIPF